MTVLPRAEAKKNLMCFCIIILTSALGSTKNFKIFLIHVCDKVSVFYLHVAHDPLISERNCPASSELLTFIKIKMYFLNIYFIVSTSNLVVVDNYGGGSGDDDDVDDDDDDDDDDDNTRNLEILPFLRINKRNFLRH